MDIRDVVSGIELLLVLYFYPFVQDDMEGSALADWKLVELEIHETFYQTSDSGEIRDYGVRRIISFFQDWIPSIRKVNRVLI